MQADTAQSGLGVDDGRVDAVRSGPEGGVITARPAPYDQKIRLLSELADDHENPSSLSVPSRPGFARKGTRSLFTARP